MDAETAKEEPEKRRTRKRAASAGEPAEDSVAETAAEQGGSPRKVIVRDIGLALAALTIWGAADTWAIASGLWLAKIVAVGNGILVGVLIGFLFHEWGHFAGAYWSGAKALRLTYGKVDELRYDFDLTANTQRQFQWMGFGGNIAHWSLFALALILVPLDTPSRSAFVAATLGFALFASLTEWPIIARVSSGAVEPSAAFSHLDRALFLRNELLASVGSLVFLALVIGS